MWSEMLDISWYDSNQCSWISKKSLKLRPVLGRTLQFSPLGELEPGVVCWLTLFQENRSKDSSNFLHRVRYWWMMNSSRAGFQNKIRESVILTSSLLGGPKYHFFSIGVVVLKYDGICSHLKHMYTHTHTQTHTHHTHTHTRARAFAHTRTGIHQHLPTCIDSLTYTMNGSSEDTD